MFLILYIFNTLKLLDFKSFLKKLCQDVKNKIFWGSIVGNEQEKKEHLKELKSYNKQIRKLEFTRFQKFYKDNGDFYQFSEQDYETHFVTIARLYNDKHILFTTKLFPTAKHPYLFDISVDGLTFHDLMGSKLIFTKDKNVFLRTLTSSLQSYKEKIHISFGKLRKKFFNDQKLTANDHQAYATVSGFSFSPVLRKRIFNTSIKGFQKQGLAVTYSMTLSTHKLLQEKYLLHKVMSPAFLAQKGTDYTLHVNQKLDALHAQTFSSKRDLCYQICAYAPSKKLASLIYDYGYINNQLAKSILLLSAGGIKVKGKETYVANKFSKHHYNFYLAKQAYLKELILFHIDYERVFSSERVLSLIAKKRQRLMETKQYVINTKNIKNKVNITKSLNAEGLLKLNEYRMRITKKHKINLELFANIFSQICKNPETDAHKKYLEKRNQQLKSRPIPKKKKLPLPYKRALFVETETVGSF